MHNLSLRLHPFQPQRLPLTQAHTVLRWAGTKAKNKKKNPHRPSCSSCSSCSCCSWCLLCILHHFLLFFLALWTQKKVPTKQPQQPHHSHHACPRHRSSLFPSFPCLPPQPRLARINPLLSIGSSSSPQRSANTIHKTQSTASYKTKDNQTTHCHFSYPTTSFSPTSAAPTPTYTFGSFFFLQTHHPPTSLHHNLPCAPPSSCVVPQLHFPSSHPAVPLASFPSLERSVCASASACVEGKPPAPPSLSFSPLFQAHTHVLQ